MESKKPLNRFQIIAFSVSFENDYPNIVQILSMSKIPLRKTERNESSPFVIMGGVCASFNPEPLADFFDVCCAGEAEEMLPGFIEAFKASGTRSDLYRRLVSMGGVYLPHRYEVHYHEGGTISGRVALSHAPEKITRRFVRDLSKGRFRQSLFTPETEFSNMYLIEAMRGCPWSCRFCVAGYIYKPVRKKDYHILRGSVLEAREATGKIGLIGPSLTDYPSIEDILCIDSVDFSITSLRASPKSAGLLQFLKRHKSISIAPEAGTERLRRVVDKRITEADIIETSRLILSEGIENLRLYFMVGLPTEREEDIEGIVTLVKKIRSLSAKSTLVLTLSTFVPKPFTPFQWHPMEKMEVVKARLSAIKKALIPLRGVRVFHDVPKYAYMQGLFARGDRRLSGVLEEMAKSRDWRQACKDRGIDVGFHLFRQRDFTEMLPWDFIDNLVPKERLWSEYQKALMQ